MPASPLRIISGLENGQVLQRLKSRGATVTLQGEGATDGPLHAALSKGNTSVRGWKSRKAGRISGGKFKVKLVGLPVGGPYRLRLESGAQKVEIASFFVGDVWVLAGQSNMEGCGDMTGKAKPHPLIRAFSMRYVWRLAEDPLHVIPESPDSSHTTSQCTPEQGEHYRKMATKGVGAGIFFARDMLERTGVPQGLICTAHGGTSMAQWDPTLVNSPAKSRPSAPGGPDPEARRPRQPGDCLYGSMLSSIRATGQPVAGVLWYQGESDASPEASAIYTENMKKLVAASRRDLASPSLPWMIVQIARVFGTSIHLHAWNSIQEAQRLLPTKIKQLETVPAIDLPLDDPIHIGAQGYPRLAALLASAADRLAHGNTHEAPMPRLRSIRISESPSYTVEVAFDSVRGDLRSEGEPSGFKFVAGDGTPLELIYKTVLKGNTATLYGSDNPGDGARLHYGYGGATTCNIVDARGFPLPVFRSGLLKSRTALAPFITQWETTGVIPAETKLDRVTIAAIKSLPRTVKNYPPDGFINEHATWEHTSGHAFFQSRLHLPEPMKLEFLMGYDGPFRLWIDDTLFFADMKGTNPCLADQFRKRISLPAGDHFLRVGMDLNGGLAWGFRLRMARKDVPKAKILSGDFVRPTYSV